MAILFSFLLGQNMYKLLKLLTMSEKMSKMLIDLKRIRLCGSYGRGPNRKVISDRQMHKSICNQVYLVVTCNDSVRNIII